MGSPEKTSASTRLHARRASASLLALSLNAEATDGRPSTPSSSPTARANPSTPATAGGPSLAEAWLEGAPKPACEAAGLQAAVRAWWYGVQGGRARRVKLEDSWLRSVTARGLAPGTREALLGAAIPERIVEGGIQLGQWFMNDPTIRQVWVDCKQEKCGTAAFVTRAINSLQARFDVAPGPPLSAHENGATPSLILTPRTPRPPSQPSSRRPRQRPGSRNTSRRLPPCTPRTPRTGGPGSQSPGSTAFSDQLGRQGMATISCDGVPDILEPLAETPTCEELQELLPSQREELGTMQPLRRPSQVARVSRALGKLKQLKHVTKIGEYGALPHEDHGYVTSSPSPPLVSEDMRPLSVPIPASSPSPDWPSMGSLSRSSPGPRHSSVFCRITDKNRQELIAKSNERKSFVRMSTVATLKARASLKMAPAHSNFADWMKQKGAEDDRIQGEEVVVIQQKEIAKMERQTSLVATRSRKASGRVVKDIVEVHKLFFEFDEDQSGTIEFAEFLPLLAKLLRQPLSSMDFGEVAKKWDDLDVDGSGAITWDEFSTWYCQTFGVEQVKDFTQFFSDSLISEKEKIVREVARTLGKDNVMIEKIYQEFSKLDDDGSGSLEYEEFEQLMIASLTSSKDAERVPKTVLQKFWIDVDSDGSGSVSFPEFAEWYVKFFFGKISPMEQYYQMVGSGARRQSVSANASSPVSKDKGNSKTRNSLKAKGNPRPAVCIAPEVARALLLQLGS